MPPAVPPTPTPVDPDEEWFKAEGITDQKEKDAIIARARVNRFAAHKLEQERKKREDDEKAKPPEKKNWYD